VKPVWKLAAIGAAIAALCAPVTFAAPRHPALRQARPTAAPQPAPTLKEAPDSGFPDKVFVLQLPQKRALKTSQVTVTENGQPVEALDVATPGTSSGAILLIDASESMTGKPIADAMNAARAFMAQRSPDFPVAVMAFNPNVSVLADFSTDKHTLAVAVAKAPPTAYGTHTYDALVQAAALAKKQGLKRSTIVLLSDGQELGSNATYDQALQALNDAGIRVISVGLHSRFYNSKTLHNVAEATGGTYSEAATSAQLAPIYSAIGAELASQYVVTYRSLLPPKVTSVVKASVAGYQPARAVYTTPALNLTPSGTFAQSWVDKVILSPWLMVFVVVAVLALLVFAALTLLDMRRRSLPRRMAAYVSVPSEDESAVRRAEVTSMLARGAQARVRRYRGWRAFERDVELGDWTQSALALSCWTLIAGIVASLVAAILLQSLVGLLVGFAAPLVTRAMVSRRVAKKRAAFAEMLPENVDVIAGSLRAGHSLIGAMNVMADDATEPSKTEFRRVLQDEQLGVPVDEALMVMAQRMDNVDVEQLALVTRLQREAGGNTAEVLDRLVETMRGRMELRRLITVLTAQNRFARWILTALPVALLLAIWVTTPTYLQPLFHTTVGVISLGAWVVMLIVGSFWIKRITTMEL
jgi:tight adherence protein B